MKRIVARTFCVLLVIALLLSAGCLAENRTITVMAQDYKNSSRPWWNIVNYHEWAAGKIFDAKLEEMGITLDIEAIAKDQYSTAALTRQQAWLNMPDIIKAAGNESDWIGYGKAGKIWNIRELLEEYDEDGSIWAYLQKLGGSSFATILDENGALWWFPYVLSQGVNDRPTSIFCISIRADWLEAIGEQYKHFYTPDELLDVLVAFRENDANGNGVEDEVINFNLASEWEPISSAFGIGMNYIYALSDGSGVQCKIDHENFPAFIEYCQELYKAGVFSTEVLNEGANLTAANRASVIFDYNGGTSADKSVTGFETTARYAPAIIDDDAGVNGYLIPSADSPFMVTNGWLINKECKDPQAVVDLMNFVYSDECSDLFYYGVEGVSYYFDETIQHNVFIDSSTLYAEEDTSRSPLNNVIGNNVLPSALNITQSLESWMAGQNRPAYPEKDDFALTTLKEANERDIPYMSGTQPFAMMTDAESEAYNAVAETVNTYIKELIIDLIIGNKSLDDLPTYRAEVGQLGLDTMIEIREAQYDRFVNN